MGLPKLITVVPAAGRVSAQITVPGSKSITNRALVLAALGEGERVLRGALWSEDTQVMVECLQELGFMVTVEQDPKEPCNRTITVYGTGGTVPPGGTAETPLELFVGNAGTAARFLSAFVCLGQGAYRLSGVDRMHERPQAALFAALRELGYRVDSANDRLPALIYGAGPRAGSCRVSIEQSSQFASALLLCSAAGGWQIDLAGENADESPYVRMTEELIKSFGIGNGPFQIEPDASSGSYFQGAAWLLDRLLHGLKSAISVSHWPESGWQIDEAFPAVIKRWESSAVQRTPCGLIEISRAKDLGDSIMTAVVISPFAASPVRFTELGRLRLQECERVVALRTELSKCGAIVEEERDTLTVYPSDLHGAEIETYGDHRMAMCFATLGLAVPDMQIRDPGCVKKTFPNFFQKLAAPPPAGLGVRIVDSTAGGEVVAEDLFAV